MSPEPSPAQPPAAPAPPRSWPVLSVAERRVLGVLVEKGKMTPDTYPMSVNALVTGSNQKSNRDPLLNLSEEDVEKALLEAQQKGLAIKITGGRVVRWRHNLYDALTAGKVELAVLAELLLRGPQTEGDLRARASRMEQLDDIDALRAVLKPLKERRLIVYLTAEGKRGTMLTHGFHAPQELEKLRSLHSARAVSEDEAPAAPARAVPTVSDERAQALEARLDEVTAAVADLRAALATLQEQVAALAGQLNTLKQALGE
ncbi:MAG: DUF480 domain-containing protein [Gemmataceae bacterium]|nr:DUF480 domain-containing protein [Gemmataceae bacterium]